MVDKTQSRTAAVILAAGHGKRMKSTLPKVLHPIMGRPMVAYILQAVQDVSDDLPVMVVGHGAEKVQDRFKDSARFVLQEQQLGTGHALMQAAPLLRDKADLVLVTTADMPLLKVETFERLISTQKLNPGPITMLTVVMQDPHGFGRIIRCADNSVLEVVEEAQATPDQLAIRELNASVYCFEAGWLWSALPRIPISPKGEYYLTDAVGLAVSEGLPVRAIQAENPDEIIGINNRLHLSQAAAILRCQINEQLMMDGVTLLDPATTYIEPGVTISQDTVIYPNTHLLGTTSIGSECRIGPNTIIRDCQIGSRVEILASVLESSIVEDDVDIGPFGHLRKGAHLCQGVHMGNFGEVKDSTLGPGVKLGHFSYIGNATIGAGVNIGAGTITCNFDGENKNPTEVGPGAFIGSDTMLVAPVKVGAGARTGAGSVVTKDIPENTLVVGVPARVIRKVEKHG